MRTASLLGDRTPRRFQTTASPHLDNTGTVGDRQEPYLGAVNERRQKVTELLKQKAAKKGERGGRLDLGFIELRK
jgi:hypothetical protein